MSEETGNRVHPTRGMPEVVADEGESSPSNKVSPLDPAQKVLVPDENTGEVSGKNMLFPAVVSSNHTEADEGANASASYLLGPSQQDSGTALLVAAKPQASRSGTNLPEIHNRKLSGSGSKGVADASAETRPGNESHTNTMNENAFRGLRSQQDYSALNDNIESVEYLNTKTTGGKTPASQTHKIQFLTELRKQNGIQMDEPAEALSQQSVFSLEAGVATAFKRKYRENHGQSYELAARIVREAKVVPLAPDLILHAGHTIYPREDQKVLVHSFGEGADGKKRGKIKAIPLAGDPDGSKGLILETTSLSLFKMMPRKAADAKTSQSVLAHSGFREIEARSIIFEFSKDGNILAVLKNGDNLQVFKVNKDKLEGDALLEMIEEASPDNGLKFSFSSFKRGMDKLAFTPLGKHLAIWNSTEVKIFDCETGERVSGREISIQGSIYSNIVNLSIKDNLTYQLAAQIRGTQSIAVFKPQHLFDPAKTSVISIKGASDISDSIVEISEDFQRASISFTKSSGVHSTVLMSPGGSETLPYLNGFRVLHSFSVGQIAYFLCAKNGRYYLKNSTDPQFEIPLRYTIDEAFFRVLDIWTLSPSSFQLLTLCDDGLCIDKIDTESASHKEVLTLSDYSSLATNWPMTAYQGSGQCNLPLTIFNVKQPYRLHQIKLPGKNQQILQIKFSSDNEHLFFICDMPGESECKYQVYSVCIAQLKKVEKIIDNGQVEESSNRMKAMKLNLIYEYNATQVSGKSFSAFLASEAPLFSGKKQTGIKIQAVVQHGDSLFKISNTVAPEGQISYLIEPYAEISGTVISTSSTELLYQEKSDANVLTLKHLTLLSEQIVQTTLLSLDQTGKKPLVNWLYDLEMEYFAVICGQRMELIHAQTKKVILDVEIQSSDVALMLQQTQLMRSGHIYVGNKVLRMRYDLIGSSATSEQIETKFFTIFDQFLENEDSEKGHSHIAKESPLFSNSFKLVQYVTKTKSLIKPKTAIILPLPHKRNIDMIERASNLNTDDEIFSSSLFGTESFVSLNLTKNYYSIVSHEGLHKLNVDIQNEIDEYGEIIAVSNNGQGLVFMNNEIGKEFRFPEFTLGRMTEKGLVISKQIDLNSALQTMLNDLNEENEEFHEEYNIDIQKITAYYQSFQESPALNYSVAINDMLDFTVQISDKQDDNIREELERAKNGEICLEPTLTPLQNKLYEESLKDEERIRGFLFYMERRHFNQEASTIKSKLSDQKLFVKETEQADTGVSGFRMNSENLILWSWCQIERLRIDSAKVVFQDSQFPISGQYIINRVNCSSRNPSIVAIDITSKKDNDMIVLWNLWQKKGSGVFDVSNDSTVVTDQYGRFFIVDEGKVIMADQQCELKCFHLPQEKKEFKQQHKCRFDSSFGHKFDGDKHQWLISNSRIYTSYSYMTFLQLSKQVTNQEAIENFDVDKYNFIINQKSILSIQDIQDFEGMNMLLQAFEKEDPGFLNLISLDFVELRDNVKIYPQDLLKHSLQHGRTRYVNLYLKYLSKINEDTSLKYHDIMEKLLSYNSFDTYFESLLKQTRQMDKIKVLRISDQNKLGLPLSDTLCAQASVQSKYLNEIFFTSEFGNQDTHFETLESVYSDCQNYPVDIKYLRLDWILYTEEGFSFLRALNESGKNSLFQTPAIQMVIDYIYERFRFVILRWMFPIYLFQLFCFYLMAHLNEKALMEMGGANGVVAEANGAHIVLSLINIGLAFYQLGFMFVEIQKQGKKKLVEPYNFCKFLSNALIFIASFMIIIRPSTEEARETQVDGIRIMFAIISILLWVRFIYFMTLIDQVAPLVSIMFKIISEIKVFSLIFLVVLFAYGNSFYFIGRNQLEFDEIEPANYPRYSQNVLWAFNHVLNIALGQYNTPDYLAGENPTQTAILWILYLTGIVMLTLNLLNMLIAIMADIFQSNYDVKEQEEKRTHLRFIIDNWMMKDLCLASDGKKLNFSYKSSKQKNHKYIITAFQNHKLE